jgi:hypothetical protein
MENVVQAIRHADPRLGKFDPLRRIIYYDDFDEGYNGWIGLIGNYEGTLDTMLPGYAQYQQPMLSPVTMWDTGSHGAHDGTYSLKTATRPVKGAQNVSIKRVTFRHAGAIQVECYFTFKPEASELQLSELDVRSAGVLLDLQDAEGGSRRVMPHVRYLNALDGKAMAKWQYKKTAVPIQKIGTSGKTISHYHLVPEDWEDVPGGTQKLCYNEIPTKINWHYLKIGFELKEMRFLAFQCNDRVFDTSRMAPLIIPAMANLWCMLNLAFFVETDVDKRAFFFVDSVLVSGEF